jgi:thymidylate synthase
MAIMFNQRYQVDTVNDAWSAALSDLNTLVDVGKSDPSRDGAVVAELINPVLVVNNPTRNIVTNPLRNMSMRYAVGELMWYMSGSNATSDIAQFSSAWNKLSDDGETANSAYGYRIHTMYGFDQWEHAKELLRNDLNSRQAVIHIKGADDTPTKDTPCTVALQFLVRLGKLHMTVYMRSNDIWFGTPYDMFAFTCMQIRMAFELGVGIGTYTHMAGSLHLYERDHIKYREAYEQHEKKNSGPSHKSSGV